MWMLTNQDQVDSKGPSLASTSSMRNLQAACLACWNDWTQSFMVRAVSQSVRRLQPAQPSETDGNQMTQTGFKVLLVKNGT